MLKDGWLFNEAVTTSEFPVIWGDNHMRWNWKDWEGRSDGGLFQGNIPT